MTCILCNELSTRFDLAVENNWQALTPLYLQALSEHAEMCHCETHVFQVKQFMTLPLAEYKRWYLGWINTDAVLTPAEAAP